MTGHREASGASARATVHFYAWATLGNFARAAAAARGTRFERAGRAARAATERLLDEVEAEAERAGSPLVRPPPLSRGPLG